jgi:hypothetical protein
MDQLGRNGAVFSFHASISQVIELSGAEVSVAKESIIGRLEKNE